MAFEQRPNTGALFVNDKKTSDNQPNLRGEVYVDKEFLKQLMSSSNQDLVKFSLSGWTKSSAAGKKYISLSVSAPYNGSKKSAVNDEDIPF